MATTLFRMHLYFSQSLVLLLFLAVLNSRLRFRIACTTDLFSHGRFLRAFNTACGIHLSITCKNLERQLNQQEFTSFDDSKALQSIADRISFARSKSAKAYLHIFLLHRVGFLSGLGMETARESPRWSEFESGGRVSQNSKWLGDDRKTKSIRELEWEE